MVLQTFLELEKGEKYKAVNVLIEEGQETGIYQTLLVLSSIIIASGILLANTSILIGGMLITPVLSPVLLIALGIAASKPRLLKRSGLLLLKSVATIFIISFVFGVLFHVPTHSDLFKEMFATSFINDTLRSAFLYFVVALVSGAIATFGFVREKVSKVIPGVAIAVALVPPIGFFSVALAHWQLDIFQFFLSVFVVNVFGIIMGSLVVFSLVKIHHTDTAITKKIDQVEEEEKEREEKKIQEKEAQLEELAHQKESNS